MIVVNIGANLNCGVLGAEEPGVGGDRGGLQRQPESACFSYESPAPVEVGYFLFTLLLPLVFKLWDLFM